MSAIGDRELGHHESSGQKSRQRHALAEWHPHALTAGTRCAQRALVDWLRFRRGNLHDNGVLITAKGTLPLAAFGPTVLGQTVGPRPLLMKFITRTTRKITRKTQNKILAMSVAAPAMPPKPSTAAITAMTKATKAQYNRLPAGIGSSAACVPFAKRPAALPVPVLTAAAMLTIVSPLRRPQGECDDRLAAIVAWLQT
jgi:hypothetical protein